MCDEATTLRLEIAAPRLGLPPSLHPSVFSLQSTAAIYPFTNIMPIITSKLLDCAPLTLLLLIFPHVFPESMQLTLRASTHVVVLAKHIPVTGWHPSYRITT